MDKKFKKYEMFTDEKFTDKTFTSLKNINSLGKNVYQLDWTYREVFSLINKYILHNFIDQHSAIMLKKTCSVT